MLKAPIRIGERINNADLSFNAKCPIILPAEDYLTKSIIVHYHEQISEHISEGYTLNLLSQKYWIINSKATVREVMKQCLVSQRKSVKPGEQVMSELPTEPQDMQSVLVFKTGLNVFNPLMVRKERSKQKTRVSIHMSYEESNTLGSNTRFENC